MEYLVVNLQVNDFKAAHPCMLAVMHNVSNVQRYNMMT